MSLSDRVTWHVMRLGALALAAGRIKVSVTGLEHIPREGPVLLVARHYHHLFDGVVLLLSMPRRIHILVTLDWATNRYARRLMTLATKMARWPVVLRNDALRAGVNHAGEFFSATDIRRYQRSAISDSVTLLAEGGILVVFPEGYPNIDPHYTPKRRPEEFLPFRSGFATIATAAEKHLGIKIPLVPGGFRYRKDSRWTAQLNIGKAFYLEDFASRQLLVRYTERRVAELSGRS
jgi:1-acyl-sn-glycerol-3-phosphate acyltransferase